MAHTDLHHIFLLHGHFHGKLGRLGIYIHYIVLGELHYSVQYSPLIRCNTGTDQIVKTVSHFDRLQLQSGSNAQSWYDAFFRSIGPLIELNE